MTYKPTVTLYNGVLEYVRKTDLISIDASAYTSLADAVTAWGSSNISLTVSTTQTVADDLTIPRNIQVIGLPGCMITPAAGKTLIIYNFEAGDHQCFDCTLGGIVRLPDAAYILMEWFGAKGDSTGTTGTNDTPALQYSLDAMAPLAPTQIKLILEIDTNSPPGWTNAEPITSTSGGSGLVSLHIPQDTEMYVRSWTGTFLPGDRVTGATSGCSGIVTTATILYRAGIGLSPEHGMGGHITLLPKRYWFEGTAYAQVSNVKISGIRGESEITLRQDNVPWLVIGDGTIDTDPTSATYIKLTPTCRPVDFTLLDFEIRKESAGPAIIIYSCAQLITDRLDIISASSASKATAGILAYDFNGGSPWN